MWKKFCKRFGLKLFDAIVTPAQDNCSIRVFFSKNNKIKQTNRLRKLLGYENKNNINTFKTSKKYQIKSKKFVEKLKKRVN